jgi:hypothetical protein
MLHVMKQYICSELCHESQLKTQRHSAIDRSLEIKHIEDDNMRKTETNRVTAAKGSRLT